MTREAASQTSGHAKLWLRLAGRSVALACALRERRRLDRRNVTHNQGFRPLTQSRAIRGLVAAAGVVALSTIAIAQQAVEKQFGQRLETEIGMIGEF